MHKPDRRVEKTKAALFGALGDLLREKKYAGITIQEIIDRANVGRTTFYQHYTDKDALLMNCIETVFESMNSTLPQRAAELEAARPIPVAEIFSHIRQNSRLINGIMMTDSGDVLFEKFKSYWDKKIEPLLLAGRLKERQGAVPEEILRNHITSTLVELLRWWMKFGAGYTAEQMEEIFYKLIWLQ